MFPGFDSKWQLEMEEAFRTSFARYGLDHDRFTEQRWAIHRAHPDVNLDLYRCRLLHRFGQIVSAKTTVYLDLKYWINLRKVLAGRQVEQEYVELYSLLTAAVEAGAVVCPLSFWIFEELLKQADFGSRRATAQLIDRLSDGVAFMTHGEIVGQEALHFIRKFSGQYDASRQWPIHECIWTRTRSFLGDQIPVWTGDIPASDQLLAQKNIEDISFFIPLEELIDDFKVVSQDMLYVGRNVDDINRRKLEVRREHGSFKSLFLAELMHSIKENEDHWYEAMAYLHSLETGAHEAIDASAIPEPTKRAARNLVWYAFKKNKIVDELPSYHIPASLYAAACWDHNRQLNKNDVFDFLHAQLAIPYCDVFLTESSLKSLACSGHVRLDSIYGTTIISDPCAAVSFFKDKRLETSCRRKRIVPELLSSDTYARST